MMQGDANADRHSRQYPPDPNRPQAHRPQPLDHVPKDGERHVPEKRADQHPVRRWRESAIAEWLKNPMFYEVRKD
jgi:hypothetical protein